MRNATFAALFWALICLLPTSSAKAQMFDTGNDFMGRCAKPDDTIAIACAAYIRGISEGTNAGWRFALLGAGNPNPSNLYCYPPGVRFDQIIAVYLKWLEQNPEKRHYPNSSLFFQAMIAAFPCPSK